MPLEVAISINDGADDKHQWTEHALTNHLVCRWTLKQTRGLVMMPRHLHFADKYNGCMDKMLAVEERKMECEFQLRGIQVQATVLLHEVLHPHFLETLAATHEIPHPRQLANLPSVAANDPTPALASA